MKKRILAGVMGLAMLLTACGGGGVFVHRSKHPGIFGCILCGCRVGHL